MEKMRNDVQAQVWDVDTEKTGKKPYSRPQLSVITVGGDTEQGGYNTQDGSIYEAKDGS